MLDHESAVLYNFNSRLGKDFRRQIGNAGLEPNRFWPLGENILYVLTDVMGPAKDVDHIDRAGYVGETPVYL